VPDKRRALGRGLNALIPDVPQPAAPADAAAEVDLDLLEPNRHQPRRIMDDAKLEELAQSIRGSGIIQPIVVRRRGEGAYEIVAGERRWRAAQRAGLLKVPVLIRDVPDDKRLELALIENVQREDLNSIEAARAYKRLADEFQLTQLEIASAVGKDRATVANYQRLLSLPAEVQADVATGVLSMGHARALVALPDASAQRRAARDVRARELSVRETELLVKKSLAPPPPPAPAPDPHTKAAAERLRVALGTSVEILRRRRGGRIQIHFRSEEELQRLFEQLTAADG
jgi:ParB family chromosome partitioning protein